jgi:hypothetical protein
VGVREGDIKILGDILKREVEEVSKEEVLVKNILRRLGGMESEYQKWMFALHFCRSGRFSVCLQL